MSALDRAAGPPGEMPGWLRDALRGGPPFWLRARALTGGHQATAAEKRAVYARFTAKRDAARSRPAAYGRVLASARAPEDVSPFARRFYGAGR